MSKSVLIPGGAGFIGSALSARLVDAGYDVAIMDSLLPQVHGGKKSIELPPGVRFFTGDVTHAPDWDAVLRMFRPTQIVHLAAETGTAQSLSQATRHGAVNVVGTTQLLDALSRAGIVPDQIVVASSRAVYGEGAWQSGTEIFYPGPRSHAQLEAGIWDAQGPGGDVAVPVPSYAGRTETRPTNIYGATKLAQENLLTAWTSAHDTGVSILRLQNAYGPGQSLSNPYTGVVPFFARVSRELRASEVYEDGRIVRDLVYIDDVIDALFATVTTPTARTRCLDIGSGSAITVHELAKKIAAVFDAPEPVVVGKYRDGDVRAASCDITAAQKELSWQPKWALDDGLRSLLDWIGTQTDAGSADYTGPQDRVGVERAR